MARSRYDNKRKNKARTRPDRRSDTERSNKRFLARESSTDFAPSPPTQTQVRAVERLLSGIGVPEQKPLKPDDFQTEALEAIEREDVLVTAPTGSGKTWIAREEIRRLLAKGQRAWYTTPLKALTNSKYVDFR